MDNLVEIVLQAIDNASDVFSDVTSSAEDMGTSLEGAGDNAAASLDNVETEAEEAKESIDAMADLMAFQALSDFVNQLADSMWELADKAGDVQDSWTRVGLAAEGAGIPIDDMKNSISSLSAETGRSGGRIREAFIEMASTGVTSLDSMQAVFEGASAQSFILGRDVNSLVGKFSALAMRSSIAERTLRGTGVTVEELGNVLGIEGATIDDVNAKWETMDSNARAAALGQAAAMNEGKDANEEYKHSWEGLQAQIDIAKSKLEVMLGNVLLPVLIPALQAAGNMLSWLGDVLKMVMDSPLGGFISVIGSAAAGLVLLMAAVTTVTAGMGFFTASLMPAIAASWALIAPWLPFIAAAALIVAAVYEIGKAFGWWDDASGMVEALSSGIMRLWDAFINHPDVQAFLEALSGAWSNFVSAVGAAYNAVLAFFGVNTSGSFDIVRALIDGIGAAWDALRPVLMAVVAIYTSVLNGDIPGLLRGLLNLHRTIFNSIVTVVSSLAKAMATKFVSILQGMVSSAKSKASSIVTNVVSTLKSLPGKISSALSGVVNAIVKPFQEAYEKAKGYVDKIRNFDLGGLIGMGGDELTGNGFNAGVDLSSTGAAMGGELTLVHDFKNLPSGVSAGEVADIVIATAGSKEFGQAIASNTGFQSTDLKIKNTIAGRANRSLGV